MAETIRRDQDSAISSASRSRFTPEAGLAIIRELAAPLETTLKDQKLSADERAATEAQLQMIYRGYHSDPEMPPLIQMEPWQPTELPRDRRSSAA